MPKTSAERIAYIKSLLESGQLRAAIDPVLPASAIVEAQNYSKAGRAKGKIVLTFGT